MADHWLVRYRLAKRTGPGPIDVLRGMRASWSGSNWQFTAVGTLALLATSAAAGLAAAITGRWLFVHL